MDALFGFLLCFWPIIVLKLISVLLFDEDSLPERDNQRPKDKAYSGIQKNIFRL